jgi:hypothetical protein
MKTAIQTIRESVKASGHPQTMRGHFEQNRDQLEVFLPSGESMLCQSVRTIPRNLSMFVTPDALRSPAALIQCSTAPVWFLWMDAALHGQFHDEQSAIEAAAK